MVDLGTHITSEKGSWFSRRKSLAAGVGSFLLLIILTTSFIYQRFTIARAEQKEDILEFADKVKSSLHESFTYSLTSAKMLAVFISANHEEGKFDSVIRKFVRSSNYIDAIQLLPNGILSYEYPATGKDSVFDLNLFRNPESAKAALLARFQHKSLFSSSIQLKGGVRGMASYHPVYNDSGFWGFVGVVSNLNSVFLNAGIDTGGRKGYYFNISSTNRLTGKESIIRQSVKSPVDAQEVIIKVPNGEWKITVIPAHRYMGSADLWILFALAFSLSALGGIFVFHIVQRPQRLNQLVKERTDQLIENEENYKTLFEKNPLPLWIYDKQSLRFLEVNEAAREFYGYSVEEFDAMTVLDIRLPGDVEDFIAQINRNNGTNLREAGVWTHIKKDKQTVKVFIFSRNIDYKGHDAKLVLLIDVSERTRIEQEFKRSEEKYRMLINQASDGIILYSFDGKIHSFNHAACEQTGYTEEEFSNVNMHTLFIENRPVPQKGEDMPIVKDKGTTLYRWVKRKNGSEYIVELNARLLDDGKILAILRDITEREEILERLRTSEERFATSFRSSITAFSIIDNEGMILDANASYKKLLAIKDEVIGKTSMEAGILWHASEDTRLYHRDQIRQLMDEKGRIEHYELDITASDGEHKTVLLSIEPIRFQNVLHWFVSAINITRERQREEEIRSYNERFSMITSATRDAIWDHDFRLNKTWGNKKLYDIYGYDPDSDVVINFETYVEHLHPDDRDGIVSRMYKSIELKKEHVEEYFRFRMADGSYRNFLDRAFIQYDANGKATRIMGAMRDMTEEENAKTHLLKEKAISDSIINSLPGIFYLVNARFKFIRWNKNFESITGYTTEELGKMTPSDIVPSMYHESIKKIMEKSLQGEYQHIEVELLCKNGKLIPYFFNGQPIYYEDQHCVMGIGLDLSEQRRAQQKIMESEIRYRDLIEQASDGIIVVDPDGNYVEVNSSFCSLLGYTKEELLSMNSRTIVPSLAAEVNLSKKIEEIQTEKESVINEVLLKKKDGTLIQAETHSKKLPDGNLISFIRDLTERKKADRVIRESEERYRALVEKATEVLMLYDIETRLFVNVSESAGKMFKKSTEELLTCGFREISPGKQHNQSSEKIFEEKLKSALTGEKVNFEWDYIDSSNHIIPCETWLVRLPGPRVLIRASIHDISERKKYEKELKNSSEELRALYNSLQNVREEERQHIAREIHDELGQQLTGLKMDIYSVYRSLKTDDNHINKKMQETLGLIDQTMSSVRKIAMELRPSILDDLGLLPALEWQAEEFEKRSFIKVNFHSNISHLVVEPNIAIALFRIFQELLTNIGRHSEATHVNVRVYIEGSSLFLRVEDDGKGFDREAVEFKKTLGLTGIKERVNMIDGTYEVNTGKGKGTRVLVSVPVVNNK